MTDFSSEIKRFQKLSCIALSPEEEKKLGKQLEGIIDFLGQLPENKLTTNPAVSDGAGSEQLTTKEKLSLRTIAGVKENTESKKILKNVKHPIVNNSIVIKSVLS